MKFFNFIVRILVFRSELISPDSNSNSVILAFSVLMGSKVWAGCDLKGGRDLLVLTLLDCLQLSLMRCKINK